MGRHAVIDWAPHNEAIELMWRAGCKLQAIANRVGVKRAAVHSHIRQNLRLTPRRKAWRAKVFTKLGQ